MVRERAWAPGAGPDLAGELFLELDATVVTAPSNQQYAAGTWKRTFGFHPLLCFLDRPEIASGAALAGIGRPGSAGLSTAIDHEEVLRLAVEALPGAARPREGDLASRRRAGGRGPGHAPLRHGLCRGRLLVQLRLWDHRLDA